MNKSIIIILLGWLLLSWSSIAADSPDTPVASYANRPGLREKVGARADTILSEHRIESIHYGSSFLTIAVPASQAAEARQLLAKAIKAEKLQFVLKGDRYDVVTPDSVLEPKKPQ